MTWWRCKGCYGPPVEGDEYQKPWIGPCPHCGGSYNAERVADKHIGKDAPASLTGTTAASSTDEKYKIKKVSTGVPPLDLVLSGGVALSQSILMAGTPGCRKSSIAAMMLQGLTKHSKRYMLYISAEESVAGVQGRVFGPNGVTSPQVLLHATDEFNNNIDDIIRRIALLKPYAVVLDSLQAVSLLSGISEEIIAKRLADYCDETNTIMIIICQLTKGGEFKGGTGASYFTSTLLLFEPFRPSIDGDPETLFGPRVAHKVIGYNAEMKARDNIEELRVMIGGAFGKNRFGAMNQKAYIYTDNKNGGAMIHLPLQTSES
jgi:predicted ATP-dependent serine protease